jgi:hypothetical protein
MQAVFGIDVRNYDGLIVGSDMNTGVWFFKMDGFNGWNGHDWGMPNISSVQDYDHGPDGAAAPTGKPAAAPKRGRSAPEKVGLQRVESRPGGPYLLSIFFLCFYSLGRFSARVLSASS